MHILERLAALVAIIIAAAVLVTLATYIRRWQICGYTDDEALPFGWVQLLAACAAESLALAVLIITRPLGLLIRSGLPLGDGSSPIVLIHGWGWNAASLWRLRRRLLRSGLGPVVICRYPTWRVDAESAAARLHQLIVRLYGAYPGPITLIGYGLGGLVARYCLRRYPSTGVRRLITLGTPHRGTGAASARSAWWPGGRHRRPDSSLLVKLNTADRVPAQFEVIAIASRLDALVVPPINASYPGAFNIEIRDVGHSALLFSRRVLVLIEENLRHAPPA